MGNVIRTWKWPIPKDPASLPADIPWMYCRNHGRADDLVPIRFEGETLYLCPRCGEVYSIDWETKLPDKMRTWPRLYQQPYHWHYFHRGSLAYAYIHCKEGISWHPFLALHCSEVEQDAADLLMRYLISIADEWAGKHFFLNMPKKATVESYGSKELIITSGDRTESWPVAGIWSGDYRFFRETEDSITLEDYLYENHYDRMIDQDDDFYEYYYCRITCLGDDPDDLPSHIERTDPQRLRWTLSDEPICIEDMEEWAKSVKPQEWISKDPFGLSGYYLFEGKKVRLSPTEPTS